MLSVMENSAFGVPLYHPNLPTGMRQTESQEVVELHGSSKAQALASDRLGHILDLPLTSGML